MSSILGGLLDTDSDSNYYHHSNDQIIEYFLNNPINVPGSDNDYVNQTINFLKEEKVSSIVNNEIFQGLDKKLLDIMKDEQGIYGDYKMSIMISIFIMSNINHDEMSKLDKDDLGDLAEFVFKFIKNCEERGIELAIISYYKESFCYN